MNIMKKFIFPLILLFLLSAGQAFAAQAPMERLKDGIQGVINILEDPQYKGVEAKQNEMTGKIRETIKNFFNFTELSKRAIGRPWLQFTPEERSRFVGLFTSLLEQTYLEKIRDYSGEQVVYDKETIIKGKYAQVDTRLVATDKDIPVFYRMKLENDEWDVYDVKIEGVSLVNNYRTQFAGILDTSTDKKFAETKAELFKRMEEKIKSLENKKTDTKKS